VGSIITDSSVNSNPAVAKNPEVCTDGDKFCFGALSAGTVMLKNENDANNSILYKSYSRIHCQQQSDTCGHNQE